MEGVVELRATISMIKHHTFNEDVHGLTFCTMVLTKTFEEVVTDRLLVSDRDIRILNVGR